MWGRCMCVCLHVSAWSGRKNLGYRAIYLSSHKNVLKIYSSYFLCSFCSSCCIQYLMTVTLYIYTLQWDWKWGIMLYCSVQKELHWHIRTIPFWIFQPYTGVHNHMYWATQGRNSDIYIRLGMRYEAEICTILISMNRAFKRCQFCCRLNFDPKSWKTIDL